MEYLILCYVYFVLFAIIYDDDNINQSVNIMLLQFLSQSYILNNRKISRNLIHSNSTFFFKSRNFILAKYGS